MIVLISVLVNSPTLFLIRIHETETIMCEFAKITPLSSFYYVTFVVILYIIPSLLIGAFYWRIITYLKNYVPPGHVLQQQDAERQNKRHKIIKMLLSITLCYILLTWPYFVTLIGIAITKKTLLELRSLGTTYFLLAFFSFCITNSITILNPLIYFKFDKKIRERSLAMLKRKSFLTCNSLNYSC